jgi:hypothetical protein
VAAIVLREAGGLDVFVFVGRLVVGESGPCRVDALASQEFGFDGEDLLDVRAVVYDVAAGRLCAELAKGKHCQLRRIARNIVRDQAKEMRTMNAWRQAWYGAPSPAGGVPTA